MMIISEFPARDSASPVFSIVNYMNQILRLFVLNGFGSPWLSLNSYADWIRICITLSLGQVSKPVYLIYLLCSIVSHHNVNPRP